MTSFVMKTAIFDSRSQWVWPNMLATPLKVQPPSGYFHYFEIWFTFHTELCPLVPCPPSNGKFLKFLVIEQLAAVGTFANSRSTFHQIHFKSGICHNSAILSPIKAPKKSPGRTQSPAQDDLTAVVAHLRRLHSAPWNTFRESPPPAALRASPASPLFVEEMRTNLTEEPCPTLGIE